MSKVAQYLNEHLQGEVTIADAVRERFATDASVLRIVPDLVAYPRSTSDIRKIARFSWQLAEKGHKLSITARGAGSDQTGAAIGAGIIINMLGHMNEIFELDVKQKLVRLQPGVTFKALNDALFLNGLIVPSYPASASYSTIGGAIANNASGMLSAKYGATGDWVSQLEVVLANGDVIQTGRINKRELARKKGQQDFEGEIYRGIDNIITDNAELLNTIALDVPDNMGYNIVDVKRKDGSFDLTPLFMGSQGTLGIISEVIMRSIEATKEPLVGAIAFANHDSMRDGIDQMRHLNMTALELIDARLFERALELGKRYPFYTSAKGEGDVAAVVVFEYDNPSGRAKKSIAKKIAKLFEKNDDVIVEIARDLMTFHDIRSLLDVESLSQLPVKPGMSAPSVFDGVYVPPERFEDFAKAVGELETKYHVELALYGHAGQNVYFARPQFDFSKGTERQKAFKLLNDWSLAVAAHGGHVTGESSEGRLKALFAYKDIDADTLKLIESVRSVFDPQGTLNTGVKQSIEIKDIAKALRTDYDGSDFANHLTSSN